MSGEEIDAGRDPGKHAEINYRHLAQNVVDVITCHTPDGTIRYISPAVEARLGYRPDDLVDKNMFKDLIHPDDLPLLYGAGEKLIERSIPFVQIKHRIRKANGEYLWAETTSRILPEHETGEGILFLAVSRDITERLKTEQELQESEHRFRELVSVGFDGIAISRKGILVEADESFAASFGLKPEEIRGKSVQDLVAPEYRKLVMERMISGYLDPYETKGLRLDGSTFPAEVCGRPIIYKGEEARITALRDLTDKRRVEEALNSSEAQLLHAQKLEAIGTLAAGVAHEFNNVITAILGHAQVAALELPDDHPAAQDVKGIIEASALATDITRALLTFSRKSDPDLQAMNFCEFVEDSCRVLERVLPRSIEVSVVGPPCRGLWVRADESQLSQVLMNLVINARDAMPNGGTLRVAVSAEPASGGETKQGDPPPIEGRALLRITDDGSGMAEEIRDRAFEPFYTTKTREKGTGLGLAVAHGIVQAHQGRIEIDSEEGKGTSVTLSLPLCAPPKNARKDLVPPPVRTGQGELILVAEDNADVGTVLSGALQRAGYEVALVSDGAEALDSYRQNAGKIRLIIMDVDMPKLSGPACLREIQKSGGRLPAILISGYPVTDESTANLQDVSLLLKPFPMDQLLAMVGKMLDETPNRLGLAN